MNLKEFSALNKLRCESDDGFCHKIEDWSLSDWMTAVLGELGEAANIIKKLNRVRDGMGDLNKESELALRTALADELADADIYLDLLYQRAGIDRGRCIALQFNATSEKHDMPYTAAFIE